MKPKVALLVLLVVGLVAPSVAVAIELADPDTYAVRRVWSAADIGIPSSPAGLIFSAGGETLYVVSRASCCPPESGLYAIPVVRDGETGEVVDLEAATLVVPGALGSGTTDLGPGWEVGPEGTLFYGAPRHPRRIAQRPGGFPGEESLFDVSLLAGRPGANGLTFSPHLFDSNTGFGMLQTTAWHVNAIFNVHLQPVGGGLYEPKQAELFAAPPLLGPTFCGIAGVGQIQYIHSGPYFGDLLYADRDVGRIMILRIDMATGLAIDATTGEPRLGTRDPVVATFASDLGVGPWALEFDSVTGDLFIGTLLGEPADSILLVDGFPPPEPLPERPTASFSLEVNQSGPPATLTVDGSRSAAPENRALSSYLWDFGDGLSAEGVTATHTYDRAGRYFVTLTVTDTAGMSRTAQKTVEVSCPAEDLLPWRQITLGGALGGASRVSGAEGSFSLCAGGEIGLPVAGGTVDAFHYVYQAAEGDVLVEARIIELEARDDAKVGVMVRSGLAFVATMVQYRREQPGYSFAFLYREDVGEVLSRRLPAALAAQPNAEGPWVQLRRRGDEVAGLVSLDGDSWLEVGRVRVRLRGPLFAGVAASGGDEEPRESFVAPQSAVRDADVRAFDPGAEPEAKIFQPLDLSDIVALGDGTSPPAAAGDDEEISALDVDTGRFGTFGPKETTSDLDGINPSPVRDSPFIDSVFFVDSEEFPINSDAVHYRFPRLDVVGRSLSQILSNRTHDLSDGIRAGERQGFETCVGIGPSAGVTFDLGALRERHGDDAVHSLTAFLGLDWGLDGCSNWEPMSFFMIFSSEREVLPDLSSADGEAWTYITIRGRGESYEALIPPEARYLSLVGGAGDGNLGCDHGVFAEARIWPRPPERQAEATFLRGDANADGRMDLSDGVFILNFLFVGAERPPCEKSLDTNDSGNLDLADAILVFNHLFAGGPAPADPAAACGVDPTPDALACETASSCP